MHGLIPESKKVIPIVSAKDFILQILIPLRMAWGYIWGYAGTMWTAELQDKIEKTTDENRQASRQYGSQWIGRMVADCSGLVRWALRQLGAEIPHQARYQYTDHCRAKGKLINGRRDDGKDILPGTAVFLQAPQERIHHVGVYVGSGICVEAKGARYGVVTSKLDHWDHWGELKAVDYTDAEKLEGEIEIPERGEGGGGEHVSPWPMAVVNNPRSWLNLRKGPSSTSERLAKIPRGSTVEVLTQDGDWWQVRYAGRIGWAFAEYLQLIEPDQDEPGDTDQEIQVDPPETVTIPEDSIHIDGEEERELIVRHLDNLRLALITMTSQVTTIINLLKNKEGGP